MQQYQCLHEIAPFYDAQFNSTDIASTHKVNKTRIELIGIESQFIKKSDVFTLSETACQPTRTAIACISSRKKCGCIFTPNVKSRVISFKNVDIRQKTPMKLHTPATLKNGKFFRGTPSSASSIASSCKCKFKKSKSRIELHLLSTHSKFQYFETPKKSVLKEALCYLEKIGDFLSCLRPNKELIDSERKLYLEQPTEKPARKSEKTKQDAGVHDSPKLNARRIQQNAIKEMNSKYVDEAMVSINKHLGEAFEKMTKEMHMTNDSDCKYPYTIHIVEETEELLDC